ncbi:conserved Plasmodium protein, unknown function [Plasmodium gallinaceum]|uniref:Uncharacterized protein n=1 Tax=Plasmodium gallinaceum TaxID=5849 RepID=A0A1J1GYJ4_PLAGA|nr:conserved Plasmodium protein, unknown function [Plasmodium gallinaceum]CRG97528.1 conserved Plasmodium protein, unknown function [Plasmodium gallinaceum]
MDIDVDSITKNKKMIRNYNILEKNYHFMIKEYENISNIKVNNNIANVRIIKNLLILNNSIDNVKKQCLLNIFEKLDSVLILILKKNNANLILKLLSIFYIKLFKYANFNINDHYNSIFEIISNKNLIGCSVEVKDLHENFFKNTILLVSLILYDIYSKITSHLSTIIDYSKKIKKCENLELKYFYFICLNKIIKSSNIINSTNTEKIFKILKKAVNEKEEIIKNITIKCLTNFFILKPEYSLLEYGFFLNFIDNNLSLNNNFSLTNLKYVINFVSVIFCNCANVKYSKNNDYIDKKNSKENIYSTSSKLKRKSSSEKNKLGYIKENTKIEEEKKKNIFSDFLKIATEEIVSKITKIKLEENNVENYIKLENVEGFLFLDDNEFNKKILKKKKNFLSFYNFKSFLNYFKNVIINLSSDINHDYMNLKKLYFLKNLEKYNYYKDKFFFEKDFCAYLSKKNHKKYEFLKEPKSIENFNFLLGVDYKLMKEKKINYDEISMSIEEKILFKIYNSLIRNTLLKIIFFESFKNLLFFSKKFTGKSIIKIIKFFVNFLEVLCSNCAKKKNLKTHLYTNNISNSFEIKYCIFYFINIIKELIKKKEKDTYTIIKEKKNKSKENEKNIFDESENTDHYEKNSQYYEENEEDSVSKNRNICNNNNQYEIEKKDEIIFNDTDKFKKNYNSKNFDYDNTKKLQETTTNNKESKEKEVERLNFDRREIKQVIKKGNINNHLLNTSNKENQLINENNNSSINTIDKIINENTKIEINENKNEMEKTKKNYVKNFKETKIRKYLEREIKNYLTLNNDTNLDINEKKKNDIILKALISLYNKIIVNNNIKKEKYEKYEKFLKTIINNMNGMHVDIELVKDVINLFLKIFLRFPSYIYNIITLLVNYITIINANFMTSLTLNTFDDIEKQVSILIISSVSLKQILYYSSSYYKMYHLNNLIFCIFDICKLFLSKVQTHPLKTINELRRIISFLLIHSILYSVMYELKSNNMFYSLNDLDHLKTTKKNIGSSNNLNYYNLKQYFNIHEVLYNNPLLKLIKDILKEMINEIEEEKMKIFIHSYEEQISKKKMNSCNFFVVDNLFILVYILKNVYVILSSEMLTFLFFDYIYKIANTLFNFFYKLNEINCKYNKENNEVRKNYVNDKEKEKNNYINSCSKKENKNFYFYEYGFTQICRLISIDNILLVFFIYLLKIFTRIMNFIKLKLRKRKKNKDFYFVDHIDVTSINNNDIKSDENYNSNNINNDYKILLKNEEKDEFRLIFESLINVQKNKETYFDFFLTFLINFTKNKNNFYILVVNSIVRRKVIYKAKDKYIANSNKKKKYILEYINELDILNILTNNYEKYHELILINFICLFELYLKKKKYYNKIMKNISVCILNLDEQKNELIMYLLILENFLKKNFHKKRKEKLFKSIQPLFNLLNDHFNYSFCLIHFLIIKILTLFISNNENVNSFIFSYAMKLYEKYSMQMNNESYLYVLFSILIKNLYSSYYKINYKNSSKKKIRNINLKKSINLSYLRSFIKNSTNSSSLFNKLDVCSNTFSFKQNSLNYVFFNKDICSSNNSENFKLQQVSNISEMKQVKNKKKTSMNSSNNSYTEIKEDKIVSKSKMKSKEENDKNIEKSNKDYIKSYSYTETNIKKKNLHKFFDIYLDMLKVIPHNNNTFITVLKNFISIIKRVSTSIGLFRIKNCLEVILAYLLKNENINVFNFKIEKGKYVIKLFNNLLYILKKKKKKEKEKEKKKKKKKKKVFKEIVNKILFIFEILLNSFEKKINSNLFKTINLLFDVIKMNKLKKYIYKLSVIIQKNIFFYKNIKVLKESLKCVYNLLKKKIVIPLHENFDYYILVIHNFVNTKKLDIHFINLLKLRISVYSFFNVNQWSKLFENILNIKSAFIYDIIKGKTKDKFSKYSCKNNNNYCEDNNMKENNLLKNDRSLYEKDSTFFYTSLFNENFGFNIHINLKEEHFLNPFMENYKSKYFFNVFTKGKNDFTFSIDTKYLVMKLLLYFLKRISSSFLIFIHNDSYYVNYSKKLLKDSILKKEEKNSEKHDFLEENVVKKEDNIKMKKIKKLSKYNKMKDKNMSYGNNCYDMNENNQYINGSKNDYNNYTMNGKYSDINNDNYESKNKISSSNEEMLNKFYYIERMFNQRRNSNDNTIIDETNFNDINLEDIVENFSLYDNFECLLKVILNNINYGIKYYKLSNMAIKVLIVYLSIFKFSKIIIDEYSDNNEIKLLMNYEINIFTSIKMYYESFNFMNLNYENEEYKYLDNSNNRNKSNNDLQFSHLFLYPLMNVYNLFLFLNDIKLCNSHNKFVEYFFHFAIKDNNNNKSLEFNSFTKKQINNINKREEKKEVLNSFLFFSECDSSLFFLFKYKSFCYYIIHNDNVLNNLSIFDIKSIVKNVNYIIYDTIILYIWSFRDNNSEELNKIVHKFFTCVNEKARCLSIFYFSAFPIFIKFLNYVKNSVILNKNNYLFFKIFIYFLCSHIKEYNNILKQETKEVYFTFIFNYLVLVELTEEFIDDTEEKEIIKKTNKIKDYINLDDQNDSNNNNNNNTDNSCINNNNNEDSNNNNNNNTNSINNNNNEDSINNNNNNNTDNIINNNNHNMDNSSINNKNEDSSSINNNNNEDSSSINNNNIDNSTINNNIDNSTINNNNTDNSCINNNNEDSSSINNNNNNIYDENKKTERTFLNKILEYILKYLVTFITENNILSVLNLIEKLHNQIIEIKNKKIHVNTLCKLYTLNIFVINKFLKENNNYEKEQEIINIWNSFLNSYIILEKINDLELKGNIKLLLQHTFLKKMNLLKNEKLSSSLLKYFFQNSSINDINNYLIKMKSYEEEIIKIINEKDLHKLKIFYIEIIIFINFINTCDILNEKSKLYYNQKIIQIFINFSNKMKILYFYYNNNNNNNNSDYSNNTKKQIIISSINIIQNIFTIIKNKEESLVFYFIYNLIKNNILPVIITNSSIENVDYNELIPFNSYMEEIICYSLKILNVFFEVFISNTILIKKILIPFINFIYRIVTLCEKKKIMITKSFLIYQVDQTKTISSFNFQNEDIYLHNNFINTNSVNINCMTIYFKEVIKIFKNIAFKNSQLFKQIINEVNTEEKLLIYNLMKELINMNKNNETQNKKNDEKLDFSFLN